MSNQALYWDSSYEIVLALMDAHPETALETLSLDDVQAKILALPDFADDPALVNDEILQAILREWYEEAGA